MRSVATCILLAVLAPAVACGATVETYATVPVMSGDWEENVYIASFNPALGELEAVHFEVEGVFNGWIRHENIVGSSCGYYDHLERYLYVTMDLSAHNDALISFDDSIDLAGSLHAYDGTVDFDGPSGATHQVYTPISGGIVIEMPYAADFVGTHVLNVHLVTRSSIDLGLENRGVSESESDCSVTIHVTYVFEPNAVLNDDLSWSEIKTLYR